MARAAHTATLLPSGRVLVAGGSGAGSSAELYDPDNDKWFTVGSLNDARNNHTATLLPSGQVLIVGGGGHRSSVELYDPDDGQWTTVDSLNVGRNLHTATLLPSGQVLVAAGAGNGGVLRSAELYDPGDDQWTTVGDLTEIRSRHTATLLRSGQVLVAGGHGQGTFNRLRGALRSGERHLEPGGLARRGSISSHGDAVAVGPGTGRGRDRRFRSSFERGALRSGQRPMEPGGGLARRRSVPTHGDAAAVGPGAGRRRDKHHQCPNYGALRSGHALDGDGDGGDDFVLTFRVDRANLFSGGRFDCSLTGWAAESTDPGEVVYSPADADAAAVSGSARVTNLSAGRNYALGQCLAVETGDLAIAARWRLAVAPPYELDFTAGCDFYPEPACGGEALASSRLSLALADSEGVWETLEHTLVLPAGAVSALCGFDLERPEDVDFTLSLDDAVLSGSIFSNGFESGDTSSWSQATTPGVVVSETPSGSR